MKQMILTNALHRMPLGYVGAKMTSCIVHHVVCSAKFGVNAS